MQMLTPHVFVLEEQSLGYCSLAVSLGFCFQIMLYMLWFHELCLWSPGGDSYSVKAKGFF